MKTVKIGKFHILELIIYGFMDFWYKSWDFCKIIMFPCNTMIIYKMPVTIIIGVFYILSYY